MAIRAAYFVQNIDDLTIINSKKLDPIRRTPWKGYLIFSLIYSCSSLRIAIYFEVYDDDKGSIFRPNNIDGMTTINNSILLHYVSNSAQ